MNPVVSALVRKDLYLYRYLVVITFVIGFIGLALIMTGNARAFFVGSSIGMCAFILLAIFLSQHGVILEHKHQIHHFVLSLPVSAREYMMAKMAALLITFFVPWLIISGLALGLFLWHRESHGFVPFAITILLYFPMYFLVLVSLLFEKKAEALALAVIIFFNVGINFFIPGLLTLPSVGATVEGNTMAWVPVLQIVIAIELAVSLVAVVWGVRRLGKPVELF